MQAEIVEKVCRIPEQLDRASVAGLVAGSGYLEHPDALTVERISAYLRAHSQLIRGWLIYSGDKRTTTGWYLDEVRPGQYVVGHHPEGPRTEFSDAASACAEFIVRELREFAP